jgi:hypothetical protein
MTEAEFKKIMGASKADFYAQPKWKRNNKKKETACVLSQRRACRSGGVAVAVFEVATATHPFATADVPLLLGLLSQALLSWGARFPCGCWGVWWAGRSGFLSGRPYLGLDVFETLGGLCCHGVV